MSWPGSISANPQSPKLDPNRHCYCRLASSCAPPCHCRQFRSESGYRDCLIFEISSFRHHAQSCIGSPGSHEGGYSCPTTPSHSTNTCGRLSLRPASGCAIQRRSRVPLRWDELWRSWGGRTRRDPFACVTCRQPHRRRSRSRNSICRYSCTLLQATMLTRSKDGYGAPEYYHDGSVNGRPVC